MMILAATSPHFISIHTPHAGSDGGSAFQSGTLGDFNPHSPCGERLALSALHTTHFQRFQSTLPMRGATRVLAHGLDERVISIHTPHAGSD